MIIQNSSDIKTELFYDKNGEISPIDVRYEKHTINPNGLVQLQKLPSIHTVFIPTRKDGINIIKYKKADLIISETDFTVDYENGILRFHSSQVGKEIEVSYTNSIGRLAISAERIFTSIDNQGNVVETVQEIIDKGKESLVALEILGGATKVIQQTQANIDSIENLSGIILEGNEVKNKLDITNSLANDMDITLKSTVVTANTKIQEMTDWIDENVDIIDLNNRVGTAEGKLNKVNAQFSDISINVDNFGAKGDGITNDTQSIKNAIEYCKNNNCTKLTFSQGKKYLIDEVLKITFSNIEIEGNNSEVIWNNTTKLTGNFTLNRERYFGFFSVLGEELTTNYSILEFQTSVITNDSFCSKIKLNNMSSIEVGDYIHIGRSIGANLEEAYIAGFDILTKIIKKDSEYIYVDYYSPFDFTGVNFGAFFCKKVMPRTNIKIKNFHLNDIVPWKSVINVDGRDLNKVVCGIGVNFGANIDIENIKGTNTKFPVVMLQYGHNITVKNPSCIKPGYLGGGQGYTVHYCGVMNGVVESPDGVENRHVVDFSYSAFCKLRNLKNSTALNKAFDLHGIWEHDIIVENSNLNIIIGNGKENFPLMNSKIKFNNCDIGEILANSSIFDIEFNNCDIKLTANNLYFNEVDFNNCDISFYTMPLITSKSKTNSKKSTVKINGGKLKNYDKSANNFNIIKFKDLNEFEIKDVEVDGIVLALEDIDKISLNSKINNCSVRIASTNTELKSREIYIENNKINIDENLKTSENRIVRLDEIKNSNVLLSFSSNTLINKKLFTLSTPIIPYNIGGAGNNYDIIADNNNLINLVGTENTTNFFNNSGQNINYLSAKNNVLKNFWYKSNFADKYITSTSAALGSYSYIGAITGSEGSSTLQFDIKEIKNSFSAKMATCVFSVFKTSSSERIQFFTKNANIFVAGDIVYTKEIVGSSTVYKIYIKTVSANDSYSVVFTDRYNYGDFKIEAFNTNAIVSSVTGGIPITVI